MHPAIFNSEWVYDDAEGEGAQKGPLLGLMLGYSQDAAHRTGVKGLLQQLGLPETLRDAADCKSTRVPKELMFQEFDLPRINKRYKLRPSAILTLVNKERMNHWPVNPVERARAMKVLCTLAPGVKESSQILCAWDSAGFAVGVSGEENIENLRMLYQAFLDTNVSLVPPNVIGLTQISLGFCLQDRLQPTIHRAFKWAHRQRKTLVQLG